VPSCFVPISPSPLPSPSLPQTALYQEKQRPIAREVTHLRAESDISDAKAKLEVLRKGCCHPQVWDKDLTRRKGQGMARPFEEIMILKVEQSRLACEEKQRELVFHLNSLAGVAMLQAQLLITEGASYRREDRAIDVDADGGAFLGGVSSPSLRTENPAADLSAADYLRRAMRAFGSAYSCLERNRQTCPLLGLVRLSGTPEGAFRATRPADGEESAETDKNLVNTELRADCLCLSWSCRLPRVGEGRSDAGEEEVCFPALSLPSVGAPIPIMGPSAHGQSVSNPVPSPSPSSLQAERVFSLCGFRAPVSARMAFGAGRRLQKLRVRSRVSVLIAEMRSRLVSSGGRAQEAVLLFPSETSLSAATGVADAFTRVALFNLALPCLPALCSSNRCWAGAETESDPMPPSNGSGPGPDGPCGPFPLDPHRPLSAQSVQDFPLTIRARSWKLDVRSVHGWCLDIKIEAARPCSKRGLGEGEGDLDGEGRCSVVTGQWRRTATLLTHPQAGSSPSSSSSTTAGPRACSTVSMSLCMEVEVFEAAFDVDLFQVKIGLSARHCRLLLLHPPPLVALCASYNAPTSLV
jgi:hypothetical protein